MSWREFIASLIASWGEFIASLIASLAWPAVIVVALVLVRKQLGGLAGRLEELSVPGGHAKFTSILKEAGSQAEQLEQESPSLQQPAEVRSGDILSWLESRPRRLF